MNNAKHFLKSKTFWSMVIAIVTAISHMALNGHLDPSDMTVITAAAAGIYGRFVAQGPLTAGSN